MNKGPVVEKTLADGAPGIQKRPANRLVDGENAIPTKSESESAAVLSANMIQNTDEHTTNAPRHNADHETEKMPVKDLGNSRPG